MKNVADDMEKYGLRLEIDAANLPVVIQTTVRPPFETMMTTRAQFSMRFLQTVTRTKVVFQLNTSLESHCQILADCLSGALSRLQPA